MWYARIKYSRQAFPMEYEFDNEQLARGFAWSKELHNPYVRWTEVDQARKYPNRPLGNSEYSYKMFMQNPKYLDNVKVISNKS